VQQEVFAISDKILRELASESLQDRMTASFVARLRSLDADATTGLRDVVESDGKALLLRSAFELPEPQHAAIESALEEICGADIDLRFEIEPQLVSGIELIANGYKIAWNVADYLSALQQNVANVMQSSNIEPQPLAEAEREEQKDS
jgi:F-type H+-transporting ATPase subunit b